LSFFHFFDFILFMLSNHCLDQNTLVCEFISLSIIFFRFFFLRVFLIIFALNNSLIEFWAKTMLIIIVFMIFLISLSFNL
jgi:hypothetical protein